MTGVLKCLPGWSSSTSFPGQPWYESETSEKQVLGSSKSARDLSTSVLSKKWSFLLQAKIMEKHHPFFFHLTHFALVFAIPPHLCFLFCNLETINIHVLFESSKIYSHLLSSEDLWAMQKTLITAFFGKKWVDFSDCHVSSEKNNLFAFPDTDPNSHRPCFHCSCEIPGYWPEQPLCHWTCFDASCKRHKST